MTKWMDERGDAAIAPTTQEVKQEETKMRKNIMHVSDGSLKCSFEKGWWALFKTRNKEFLSRLAQNIKSQTAAARRSAPQWEYLITETLRLAIKKVSHDPACIWNGDESCFMRNLSTMGQGAWVTRRRRFVARRWDGQGNMSLL